MSFDFGMSSIGVATVELNTWSVHPRGILKARNGRPNEEQLGVLLTSWNPTDLIVGLPLNMDDTESEMSRASRKFGKFLERKFALPVHFVDERLSTVESKYRTRDGKPDHAIAACVIGESWLYQLRARTNQGDQIT